MITLARYLGRLIKKCPLTTLAALLLLMAALPAQADPRSDAVDKLFAHWNSSETPGGNVLILENGHTLYAHRYGMADIELPRKNAPHLLYPIGSVSKQFTGYCIALMVADGKLALSDDIRRYLPEMHDFGTPITIAMLLYHTSGIRDNVNLLILKGHRIDDVTSEKDSFDVIVDQKGL